MDGCRSEQDAPPADDVVVTGLAGWHVFPGEIQQAEGAWDVSDGRLVDGSRDGRGMIHALLRRVTAIFCRISGAAAGARAGGMIACGTQPYGAYPARGVVRRPDRAPRRYPAGAVGGDGLR